MNRPTLLFLSGGGHTGRNIIAALGSRRASLRLVTCTDVADEPSLFAFDSVYLAPAISRDPNGFAARFTQALADERPALVIPCRDEDVAWLALYAQSQLDVQGIGQPLKEGSGSGDFDKTYHWQLNVQRYQPQAAPGSTMKPALAAPGQPELFQLELVVSWGNQYLQHHARFVTLRAMVPPQPGSNQLPSGLPPGFG